MLLNDAFVNQLLRYPGAIVMRIRIAKFRLLGAMIGRRCWLRRIMLPRNPWDVKLDDNVALDDYVVLLATGTRASEPRIVVGAGTYVNRFTMIDASERIVIGRNCLIGPSCYITDHDHEAKGDGLAGLPLISKKVIIGNDVWIGAGVIILKGVTIGDGAVVAAGAVVSRNVSARERVAGVPARRLIRTAAPGGRRDD